MPFDHTNIWNDAPPIMVRSGQILPAEVGSFVWPPNIKNIQICIIPTIRIIQPNCFKTSLLYAMIIELVGILCDLTKGRFRSPQEDNQMFSQ